MDQILAPPELRTREKALVALNLRRRGIKLKIIGNHFGVCLERARQLVRKGREIEACLTSNEPRFELSARLRHALEKDGCDEITPAKVAGAYDLATLHRLPAIGVTCIRELQDWLVRHGQAPLQ